MKTFWFTLVLLPRLLFQYLYAKRLLTGYFWDGISHSQKTKLLVYSTFLPIFYPYNLAKLSQEGLTKKKKEIATLISAIMPVNDETLDRSELDLKKYSKILELDKGSFDSNPLIKFQLLLFRRIKELDSSKELHDAFIRIQEAQIASLKQKKTTRLEELRELIASKGGYSAQLYAYAVIGNLDEAMKKVTYQFGYWIQLLDDMVDINKDRLEGVNTLATLSTDRESYINMVYTQKYRFETLLKETNSLRKDKIKLLYDLHYFTELAVELYKGPSLEPEKRKKGFWEILRILSYVTKAWRSIVSFRY